jgi:hypothetical protein
VPASARRHAGHRTREQLDRGHVDVVVERLAAQHRHDRRVAARQRGPLVAGRRGHDGAPSRASSSMTTLRIAGSGPAAPRAARPPP